jgi:hypothetical protein
MSVLVLVRMNGNTERLLEAADRLSAAFGMPPGLTAQVAAPTEEGIVIMQLWASEDQRREANEGPGHEALIESGILRETLSGTSEAYETERVQLADVVPARPRRRKPAARAKAATAPAPPDTM